MQEWRQCGRWLIELKVLPANHRVVWPSAAVFELAQALRDGVLLCQLLHNLSPGSVDLKDINFRPQMSQFLCLKNIRTFLKVCHDKFGLRNSELFDPFDLFDVRDFGKGTNRRDAVNWELQGCGETRGGRSRSASRPLPAHFSAHRPLTRVPLEKFHLLEPRKQTAIQAVLLSLLGRGNLCSGKRAARPWLSTECRRLLSKTRRLPGGTFRSQLCVRCLFCGLLWNLEMPLESQARGSK